MFTVNHNLSVIISSFSLCFFCKRFKLFFIHETHFLLTCSLLTLMFLTHTKEVDVISEHRCPDGWHRKGKHQIKHPSSSPCHPTYQLIHLIHRHLLSAPLESMSQKSHRELSNSLFLSLSIRGLTRFTASTEPISKSMQLAPGPGDFYSPPSTVSPPGAERPTTIDI